MILLRRIKCTLSSDSLFKAAKAVQEYKNSLNRKVDEFVERLADIGVETISATLSDIPQEEKDTDSPQVGHTAVSGGRIEVYLSGTQVLFIEFSAGITFGSNNYPLPSGASYGAGTYPGKWHWDDPGGWWYRKDGESHHTYGNKAYMPMYNADAQMRQQIERIAKEVFRYG